jgi:hypothetical protein
MKGVIILTFIEIQQQLKILHWQTKSYAKHNAYGKTYDELSDLVDDFVEIAMGKYGRFELTDGTIELFDIKNMSLQDFIDSAVEFLISLSGEFSGETDTDLLNIRDEMLGQFNKLKYLLTLE